MKTYFWKTLTLLNFSCRWRIFISILFLLLTLISPTYFYSFYFFFLSFSLDTKIFTQQILLFFYYFLFCNFPFSFFLFFPFTFLFFFFSYISFVDFFKDKMTDCIWFPDLSHFTFLGQCTIQPHSHSVLVSP